MGSKISEADWCVHGRELLEKKGCLLKILSCNMYFPDLWLSGAWGLVQPEQEGPSPFSGAFLSPIVVSGGFEGLSDVSV